MSKEKSQAAKKVALAGLAASTVLATQPGKEVETWAAIGTSAAVTAEMIRQHHKGDD